VHKVLRIAASGVEKYQIGRRIIQKTGEDAREPEIHGIYRLPIVRNKVNQGSKRTVSTCAQNGNGGNHTDKNAKEQLGNFLNGAPGKTIEFTAAPARELERKPGQAQQRHIAQQVLPFDRHAEDRNQFAQRVEARKQHGHNNAQKKQQVDLAVKAELFFCRASLSRRLGAAFFLEQHRIKDKEDTQQNCRHKTCFHQQVGCGPEEIHTLQKTQKQRRIAQRRERAANICHKKNKKDNRVNTVFTVRVGPKQGADKQHGRAGCSHPAGQHSAHGQQPGIDCGGADKRTGKPHAACDGKEREQQHQKRNIIQKDNVQKLVQGHIESINQKTGR